MSTTDPRFAKLHTDPRFVRPKAAKHKLVVDERFKEFFDDSDPTPSTSKGKAKRAHKVDKYGRPLEKASTSNELKRYYRMPSPSADTAAAGAEKEGGSDEEESEEEEGTGKPFVDLARGEGLLESSDEEGGAAGTDDSDSDSEGSVTLAPATLRRRRPSPSRSPSIDLSETEPAFAPEGSDEGEIESEDDTPDVEATRRLAVVNMDWDHLRAADLYRVLASSLSLAALPPPPPPKAVKTKKFDSNGEEIGPYKPPSRLTLATGRLLNLRIYPSSFGAERMEREAREGPPTEVFLRGGDESGSDGEGGLRMGRKKRRSKKLESDDEDDEITERDVLREQVEEGGEDYDGEALRRYQLERLRYYYAVATFDTPAAAAHVYSEINGTEFERTANVFDLQYIPEETSFEDDVIHDEATEASVAAAGPAYQGVEFVTDALRHSKVTLTWDADDPHRKTKINNFLASATESKGKGKGKNAKELDEDDIRAYLASSSDDSDAEEEEVADDFFEAEDKPKANKRDKLRSLFGLDKSGGGTRNEWDGGKSSKGQEGEMQITFAPALTDAAGSKAWEEDDDERDENAIETYKRKEKERRERKRLERKAKRDGVELPREGEEGPEFGGEDTGAGGFDDAFFGEDADEAFAAFDAGDDLGSDGEIGEKKGRGAGKKEDKPKLSKRARREAKAAEEAKDKEAQAELALLVASDSDDDPERKGKHFDMRAILKAEKNKGKKIKGRKGKKSEDKVDSKDEFEINVADDRFKSLHEDYDFAIDPSNPRFTKSRNMDVLLSEGRKRRAKAHDPRAPVGAPVAKPKKEVRLDEGEEMRKLVESVKRKAGDEGGRGKRSKVEA